MLSVHLDKGLLSRFCRFATFLAPSAIAALLIALVVAPVGAQPLPGGLTPDQIQQLQQFQQQSGRASPQQGTSDQPSSTVLLPDVTMQIPEPPSRLEQILSQRAGVQLRLFGYQQLGSGHAVTINQAGAIQDSYVLGPGDEIVVSLRGQETQNPEIRTTVNRDGQVLLPRLNPISAAGRTFGSFRQDVEAAVSRAYVATNAFVSLGRVRQLSVLVSGEVNTPGLRTVSGLSSVLDAILLSGGIRKSGSLRSVRLERGGRQYIIDLYSLLTDKGGSADMRLMDGDRIRVPLLGSTVAVTGLVRQPAIYELPSGQSSISVAALIALAGGEELRGLYNLSVLRVEADGRAHMAALASREGSVRDSEVLFVQFGANQTVDRATLAGGTNLAGSYPILEGTKLSEILKAPGALGPASYTLFGIIARRDSRTLLRTLVAFTPVAVIRGSEDVALQGDDIVHIVSLKELRLLNSTLQDYGRTQDTAREAIQNPFAAAIANGSAPSGSGNGTGFRAESGSLVGESLLANARTEQQEANQQRDVAQSLAERTNPAVPRGTLNSQPSASNSVSSSTSAPNAVVTPDNVQGETDETETFAQLATRLGVEPLVLTNFLLDHRATLNGSVRGPGTYLVGPNVALQDLLVAAGGPQSWADASSVELVSTSLDPNSGKSLTQLVHVPLSSILTTYIVKPRDEFRFNQTFNDADLGNVTIQGEVRFAGTYKLTRGERLSALLARVGGLTGLAYPYGTIFLRKSAAAKEQEGYLRAANQAEDQMLVAMTRTGTNKLDPATFSVMQGFVGELRNQKALGRISVQADPSILAASPNLDIALESGDVIFIPPRPSTITVSGQVLQPGSFPYRAGTSVADYIAQAGGYSSLADESQTFVVLPDGSARQIQRSWLRIDSGTALPPGSTIVVPRDLTPLDVRQTIIDATQILSQLAVSVASLAVLSKQ